MLKSTKNDSVNNNKNHEVKEENLQNMICNRRIEHAITATEVNNRFISKCTLDICPEKHNSIINSSEVHRNIFEAIKQMDDPTAIITQNNIRITNINTFSSEKEHKISFSDQRLCKITKRINILFTLES